MRNVPSDKWDREEAERLNAEPWMMDLLALNPDYCGWGPHEDYMWNDKGGWASRLILPQWGDMFSLDDLNEVVNFYFSVVRESKDCGTCGGDGYHPDAHHVTNGFYAHMNERGESWADKITQDEVDALWDAHRLRHDFKEKPTADEVNAWHRSGRGLGHDAINRGILTEARLKRMGLPHYCDVCEGRGYEYTEPAAHVTLTMWVIHPRKGASRGVDVSRIGRDELPDVFAYLREAASRNASRFLRIPGADR